MATSREAASPGLRATRAEQIDRYITSIPSLLRTKVADAIGKGALQYQPDPIQLPALQAKEVAAVEAAYQAAVNANPDIAIFLTLSLPSGNITIDNSVARQTVATADALAAYKDTKELNPVRKPVEEDPDVAAAIEQSLFGDESENVPTVTAAEPEASIVPTPSGSFKPATPVPKRNQIAEDTGVVAGDVLAEMKRQTALNLKKERDEANRPKGPWWKFGKK
jgi:hypothetical protein